MVLAADLIWTPGRLHGLRVLHLSPAGPPAPTLAASPEPSAMPDCKRTCTPRLPANSTLVPTHSLPRRAPLNRNSAQNPHSDLVQAEAQS